MRRLEADRGSAEPGVEEPALPLDVLLVCAGLGPGGRPRVVTNLATGWSERGFRVGVATFDGRADCYPLPDNVLRLEIPGRPVQPAIRRAHRQVRRLVTVVTPCLPHRARRLLQGRAAASIMTTYLRRTALVRNLREAIEVVEPTVVVAFGAAPNIASLLASDGLACRVVVSECNDVARQTLDFPVTGLRKHLYPTAAAVSVNARGMVPALADWVPTEKIHVTPNPMVIPRNSRMGPPPPGLIGPCVLIVARLAYQKNHEVLLDAFARLPPLLEHWRLMVVGAGDRDEALHLRADVLGVAGRVDWHGHTDDPYAYYRHADIFALPSRFEGMPNALIEAMSFGLPPIVSDASPGPLELVRHGETGVVVPSDDPDALASAITLLATHPDLRRTLGDAARREVEALSLSDALATWDDATGLRRVPSPGRLRAPAP
jgi:glycosyltransferase involved in cell wall biosynthesis